MTSDKAGSADERRHREHSHSGSHGGFHRSEG
jgi:hypothetical protein